MKESMHPFVCGWVQFWVQTGRKFTHSYSELLIWVEKISYRGSCRIGRHLTVFLGAVESVVDRDVLQISFSEAVKCTLSTYSVGIQNPDTCSLRGNTW